MKSRSILSHLPEELDADAILDGKYRWPASPAIMINENTEGLAVSRISAVPEPNVHPRILFSPSDIPDIRRRTIQTRSGKLMMATLRSRTGASILKKGSWENDFYNKLADGDDIGAKKILDRRPKPNGTPGHYQPYPLYEMTLEAFDALISGNSVRGRKIGSAFATYAGIVEPYLENALSQPLNDDVWRIKVQGAVTGKWEENQGMRDLMGYHLLGYGYDFSFNFMSDEERAVVRRIISKATRGKIWIGATLPHHFRNWNWIAVGLGQPLLSLAIEGEEGFDPRAYKLGVEIARDYLTYGISKEGCSTEAVGYTQFGFVWANPFFIAATRRGDNMLSHPHHRRMIDWYLHSMLPQGGKWTSHGDGGDRGPSAETMMMWKYHFPGDARIDFLWQNVFNAEKDPRMDNIHIIEPICWAEDGTMKNHRYGAALKLPDTWFDTERSSLISRSGWTKDAMSIQFECRTDSVGASHEHADRGNFTVAALGHEWAKENFRSVESRHHNVVLVDGHGQGYWPGPGKWLGLRENEWALIAACDAKDAYDWWWPKQIVCENPSSFVRFKYKRWESFKKEALDLRKRYGKLKFEKDARPSVTAHWKGFQDGDPRIWDEDSWPVRLKHNPVRKAFRTIVFVKSPSPYMLVVDDICKDDKEHLYEWLMQTDLNTDVVSLCNDEIILSDAKKTERGPRLLVRSLYQSAPAAFHDFQSKPSMRLETFERKDTLMGEGPTDKLSGNRSFGLDKRLVVPSRSREPKFKILIAPFREGGSTPSATWNTDRENLIVEWDGVKDKFTFKMEKNGRTKVILSRNGKKPLIL